MEALTKYWVKCANCDEAQMHDTPTTIREPYTKDSFIAALECPVCGHVQVKPDDANEVAKFLSEALPADKDPVVLARTLNDAAIAFMKGGGHLIGFGMIEGIGVVFHGGEYGSVVDAVIQAIERDGLMLGVLKDAIAAAEHSNAAEAAQLEDKIVPERDTYSPPCPNCGKPEYNGDCNQCHYPDNTQTIEAPAGDVCEYCFAPGGNHYIGCASETINKLRALHQDKL